MRGSKSRLDSAVNAHSEAQPRIGSRNDGPERGSTDGGAMSWLPDPSPGYRIAKRLLDVLFSLLALILLAPLLVIISAAVKLTSRGPALSKQTRVGRHGKPFDYLKFRTMYVDSAERAHDGYIRELMALKPERQEGAGSRAPMRDPRFTRLGRFLRATSLDELPQFINVLRGDMSLVGPRPPINYELLFYDEKYWLRLSCRPGITGLWQIEGRATTTFDEMVEIDLKYIERASVWLDLQILFRTPISLVRGGGAY